MYGSGVYRTEKINAGGPGWQFEFDGASSLAAPWVFHHTKKKEKQMNKSAFVATVSALVLTACANNPLTVRKIDPHTPNVNVVDDKYIVVDQEPIIILKHEKNTWITWQLPPNSPYNFPVDGIVIANAGDEFKCNREANLKRFACMDKNSKSGEYKYTIKLMDGPQALKPRDPIIVND